MPISQTEKINIVQNVFIATANLQAIIDDIKMSRELAKINNYQTEPDCILVTGESGVGKSSLIEKYKKDHPRVELEYRTQVPVLVTSLPVTKSDKAVIAHLLCALGDPSEGKVGTAPDLTRRFIKLLRQVGVELIIIDEFHHAIELQSETVIYKVADLLKYIISESNIPMVLFGMPQSTHVFTANSQLSGRFNRRKKIPLYTKDNFEDFREFLKRVDKKLPFKELSGLSEEEFSFRLFAASGGNLRHLMKGLLKRAAIKAINNGLPNIPLDYLANEYLDNYDPDRKKNPFLLALSDIEIEYCTKESYWDYEAKKGHKKVIPAQHKRCSIAEFLVAK
ncbi:MAG: TniB family NTP-binding protein [Colwellia sp.]|nr:TniB family NTP-binding protein [Colwellia sp.]